MQFVAMRFDAHAFHAWLKTKPPCDAVVQQRSVIIFKLHHTVTIEADQVVMLGFVEEIGVVVSLITPEIDFAQQIALN